MKPVNSALAWLLKMHLIMTKPSQEPWVKEYYVLTPQGRRVAECVDKFLDEIMKIWAAVPGHKNTKLKS